ncbi:MAG: hypothetical protein AAF149_25205 [Bacteroidota bacterium]
MKRTLCFVVLILVGCQEHKEVESSIYYREYLSLVKQYQGYEITPFRGELRVVKLPNGKIIRVKYGEDNELVILPENSFRGKDSVDEINLLEEIKSQFNKNNVIALFSDSLKTEVFLTYSDSLFHDLETQEGFYHNEQYNRDQSFNYVLLNINEADFSSDRLGRLKERYRIYRLDSNWYYYRSFRFSNYEKF